MHIYVYIYMHTHTYMCLYPTNFELNIFFFLKMTVLITLIRHWQYLEENICECQIVLLLLTCLKVSLHLWERNNLAIGCCIWTESEWCKVFRRIAHAYPIIMVLLPTLFQTRTVVLIFFYFFFKMWCNSWIHFGNRELFVLEA